VRALRPLKRPRKVERIGPTLGAIDLAYRVLYGGLLSRLPEHRAVPVGQWGLRLLPLDRLPIFRVDDPSLAVALGGVRLPNPLILSSMYYDPVILRRAMGLGFGAVTTKSITSAPRRGHPQPNLVRHISPAGPGLVNCNGFQNPGLAAYRRALAGLPHRVPLIVSAAGESIDEYAEVVAGLAPLGDLVEINISSPNTRLVYERARKPADLGRLFATVAHATRRPLIVKISPDHQDLNEGEVIPLALEAGIRIVNAGNTRRIDEPRLSQGQGGLSGPALFPDTVASVRRLRERFGRRIDIIATGGIDSPARAVAALDAGATACGLFTGFITRGPLLARRILDELRRRR
jgi:dihydroorotate dehydrogenase (NAD+) catalytic subunit